MIKFKNLNINTILNFKLTKMSFFDCFILFTCFSSLIYHLGNLFWIFELFSAFLAQYLLILILGIPFLVYKKSYKILSVVAICFIILLVEIIPLYYSTQNISTSNKSLKIMSLNVHTSNQKFKILEDYVLKHNPDFILLEEVNQKWLDNLDEFRKQYPYYIESPRSHNFGISFYSKIKPNNLKIKYFLDNNIPSVIADFQMKNNVLTIIGTHPLAPVRSSWAKARNTQLDAIGQYVKNIKNSVMVIGDFNTPTWSIYFKRLMSEGNLINSQKGYGISPSWPTKPFLLLTPIDHCLISPNIHILNRRIGHNIGSDHYPLIIDFAEF